VGCVDQTEGYFERCFMSLSTWMSEYYPVPAVNATPETALAMVESKWLGLLPKALKKHGIIRVKWSRLLSEEGVDKGKEAYFSVDSQSCHLCKLYIEDECSNCPLKDYKESIGVEQEGGLACGDEYDFWLRDGDPRPMIRLIQDAKVMINS